MNRGIGLAVTGATLAGVSGTVAADVFDSVPPTTLAQFRSVMAALVLAAVAFTRRQTSTGGRLPELGLLGVTIAAVTITYYWAIERLGVGPAITIQFLGPILVLAWMRLVQRRPIPRSAWGAAAIAVIGTAGITEAWRPSQLDIAGVAAGAGAAVSLAAYLILGERLGRRLPGLTIGAYGFAVSAVVLLVASPPSIPRTDLGGWLQLAWVAIPGTAVAFMLLLAALREADPGRVGVAATVEPVVAAASAWVVLGQALGPPQVVGGAMVVLAVAAIQRFTAGSPVPV